MSRVRAAAVAGALLCLAAAMDPGAALKDPASEARARRLFRETRCLVCQGQSIDESDAPLAADLRGIVRSQVVAGRSDGQIRAYLAARYGDFVLFRPPFSPANAVLWIGPFVIVAIGAGLLIGRARRGDPTPLLSADEEARLSALRAGDDA